MSCSPTRRSRATPATYPNASTTCSASLQGGRRPVIQPVPAASAVIRHPRAGSQEALMPGTPPPPDDPLIRFLLDPWAALTSAAHALADAASGWLVWLV